MSAFEVDSSDHSTELRYDMGYMSYPVPHTEGMTSHGVNYNNEYDWTHAQDSAYSARGMYPVHDVMDPSSGSYMGYPSVPQPDIGVLPTPTYIPSAEMSFATPLSHVPYNGHENYYAQQYSAISPTSTTSNSSHGSSGNGGNVSQKPKRKRVQNHHQRKAANVRERRRMFHLNEAFDELRKRLPAFNYEKRLSRIETLRLAMTYIAFMKDVSDGQEPEEVPLLQIQRKSEQFTDEADSD